MRFTKTTKGILIALIFLVIGALFPDQVKHYLHKLMNNIPQVSIPSTSSTSTSSSKVLGTIYLPDNRYPKTIDHIRDAIASGKSDICTIDRSGAKRNRELSLKGIPTKKGFDRDEYPMAMCKEGGTGADIRYISPSDNRGAGSWIANKLEKYPNGARIRFK